MFDNTEPIFEFYASCDNAVLELDLSNMDHELLIHNSLLNPAQTIYILMPDNQYGAELNWRGGSALIGESADLVILSKHHFKILNNEFKHFERVLVSDRDYEYGEGNLIINNHSNNCSIYLKNCHFKNLYAICHKLWIESSKISHKFCSYVTGSSSQLKITSSSSQSEVGEFWVSEKEKPITLILDNLKINKDFSCPKISFLSVNKLDLTISLHKLQIDSDCLNQFSDFKAYNIKELNIHSNRIVLGSINLPKGKIYIAPDSYIEITNSNGNFYGAELYIDLSKISVNQIECKKLKFPNVPIMFDFISIKGANEIEIPGAILAKSFEVIQCSRIFINEICTDSFRYETSTGNLKFGYLTTDKNITINCLILNGQINVSLNNPTCVETLYGFGQCDLMINNKFKATKIFLNIDIPLFPILVQNQNNNWHSKYDREANFGIRINNGHNSGKVEITNLVAQLTKFVISGCADVEYALCVPAASNANYFHVDSQFITKIGIKYFKASFFGSILVDLYHGDIIITHQSVKVLQNNPSLNEYIKKIEQNAAAVINYGKFSIVENISHLNKVASLISREFCDLHLQRPDMLWKKYNNVTEVEELDDNSQELILYSEKRNEITSFLLEELGSINENIAGFIGQKIDNAKIVDFREFITLKFNFDLIKRAKINLSLDNHTSPLKAKYDYLTNLSSYTNHIVNYVLLCKGVDTSQQPFILFADEHDQNNIRLGLQIQLNANNKIYTLGIIATGLSLTDFSKTYFYKVDSSIMPLQNWYNAYKQYSDLNNQVLIDQNTGFIVGESLDLALDKVILLKQHDNGKVIIELLSLGFYNSVVSHSSFKKECITFLQKKLYLGILGIEETLFKDNLLSLSKMMIGMGGGQIFKSPTISCQDNNIAILGKLLEWISDETLFNKLINQDIVGNKFFFTYSSCYKINQESASTVEIYNFHKNINRTDCLDIEEIFLKLESNKILLKINSKNSTHRIPSIVNLDFLYIIGNNITVMNNGKILLPEIMELISPHGVTELSMSILAEFKKLQRENTKIAKEVVLQKLIFEINTGKINANPQKIKKYLDALIILENITLTDNLTVELPSKQITLDYINKYFNLLTNNFNDISAKLLKLFSGENLVLNNETTKKVTTFIRDQLFSTENGQFQLSSKSNIHKICIFNQNNGSYSFISFLNNKMKLSSIKTFDELILNTQTVPLFVCNDGKFYILAENGFCQLAAVIESDNIYLVIPKNVIAIDTSHLAHNLIFINKIINKEISFNINNESVDIRDFIYDSNNSSASKPQIINALRLSISGKLIEQDNCRSNSLISILAIKWYKPNKIEFSALDIDQEKLFNIDYLYLVSIIEGLLSLNLDIHNLSQQQLIYNCFKAFIVANNKKNVTIEGKSKSSQYTKIKTEILNEFLSDNRIPEIMGFKSDIIEIKSQINNECFIVVQGILERTYKDNMLNKVGFQINKIDLSNINIFPLEIQKIITDNLQSTKITVSYKISKYLDFNEVVQASKHLLKDLVIKNYIDVASSLILQAVNQSTYNYNMLSVAKDLLNNVQKIDKGKSLKKALNFITSNFIIHPNFKNPAFDLKHFSIIQSNEENYSIDEAISIAHHYLDNKYYNMTAVKYDGDQINNLAKLIIYNLELDTSVLSIISECESEIINIISNDSQMFDKVCYKIFYKSLNHEIINQSDNSLLKIAILSLQSIADNEIKKIKCRPFLEYFHSQIMSNTGNKYSTILRSKFIISALAYVEIVSYLFHQ